MNKIFQKVLYHIYLLPHRKEEYLIIRSHILSKTMLHIFGYHHLMVFVTPLKEEEIVCDVIKALKKSNGAKRHEPHLFIRCLRCLKSKDHIQNWDMNQLD